MVVFEGKAKEIPFNVFGAFTRKNGTIKITHIGCEFGSDW